MFTVYSAVFTLFCVPLTFYTLKCIKTLLYIAKCRSRTAQIPGLPLKPIIGNIHQIPLPIDGRFTKFAIDMAEQFPYLYHLHVTPFRATVILCHPKTIKKLLQTTEPKDTKFGGGYKFLLPWLGEGLLVSQGGQWFRNRKLLTHAFHFDILKPYMAVYNECAEILLEKWIPYSKTQEVKDIYYDVSLFSLNVIMRCALSWQDDVQLIGESHPYIRAVYRLSNVVMERCFRPFSQIDSLYNLTTEGKRFAADCNYMHRVANEAINKRRAELSTKGSTTETKRRLDFLDILLSARDEEGKGLSYQEIRNEVDTFLFEGHDTTASAISWVIYALALHPDIQDNARQEVQEVFCGRGNNPRMEWDDLHRIPYLTRCIKEAMRMYSPVPGIARTLTDPITFEGVELLPDTSVWMHIHALHHNPLVWGEDHMTFDPDRFLPERIQGMDSHAFCPFAAGPRNCIGQNFAMNEIKTVISRILFRYILTTDGCPPADPVMQLVMRSTNGIQIMIKPREETN